MQEEAKEAEGDKGGDEKEDQTEEEGDEVRMKYSCRH